MPIYEYRCRDCEEQLEVIQKFSDKPKRKCPECGGRLEKLVSSSGFILKGSGWYVTDYGRGDAKPKDKDGKSGDSAGGDDGESKSGGSKKTEKKAEKKTGSDSKSAAS